MKQTQMQQEKQQQTYPQRATRSKRAVRREAVHPLQALHDTVGNHGVLRRSPGILQAKLVVGSPGDRFEQEANRVAKAVMSDSTSMENLFPLSSTRGQVHQDRSVQDQEMSSEAESILARSGHPLDPTTSGFMESRFHGHSFSHVRIHNDEQTAKLTESLNARAFTVGRDVYWGKGQSSPLTVEGRELLAHELVHVLQQRHGRMTVEGCAARPEGILQKKQILSEALSESVWSRHHPEGRITHTGPHRWILWNFDVGSASLKPEHRKALDGIYEDWLSTRELHPDAYITCYAHASKSGSQQTNGIISRQRFDATKTYLTTRRQAAPPKVAGDYFGESHPWFVLAASAEQMARNRRVAIAVHYASRREPQEPKVEELPGRLAEEPLSESTLASSGVALKWTYKIPGLPIPLRDIAILYPEGVLDFSAAVAGDQSIGSMVIQQNNVAIKAKLDKLLDLNRALDLSFDKDKLQLKSPLFDRVVELGFEYHFTEGIALVVAFNPVPFEKTIALPRGKLVTIKGAFKLGGRLAPSPALLARAAAKAKAATRTLASGASRMGTWAVTTTGGIATTAIAGGVAGTAALAWGLSLIVAAAREEGRRKALMGYSIAGFSLRVAAEVLGSAESWNSAVRLLEELRKTTEQEDKAAYDGWVAGGLLFMSMSEQESSELSERVKDKYGTNVTDISQNLVRRLGPMRNYAADAIPRTLEQILAL